MSDQRKRIEKAKIVKTDTEGRKVYATDSTSWACGFSYKLSWDEAYKNALLKQIQDIRYLSENSFFVQCSLRSLHIKAFRFIFLHVNSPKIVLSFSVPV